MEAEDRVSHLRNDLNCSICLDVFANPLTLPCGHSFCQKCIHEHWDREETMSCFTCPECRFPFSQRPEPQKNVSLSKVVECVTALDRSRALVPIVQSDTSAHNSAPTLCQRHHQDLILYCSSDNRCICCKCLLTSCRQHEVQDIQELSHEEKKKLSNDLLASDHQQKHMEEDIEKWKCKMKDIKDFHEMMVSGILAKFDQVHKALDESQVLVIESVNCAKNAAATQASEHILLLQRHLEDLKKYEIEAKVMLGNDDVAFLEGLHQLTPVVGAPGSPNVQLCGNLQMEAVTTVLSEASRLLQQELPNLLHPEIPIDKLEETLEIPSAIAVNYTSLSEQKTPIHRAPTRISALRAQLCKDYHNLKFDSETASRYIAISHENCKATHKLQLRRNNVQDSPNRFQTWQVMCTEGFSEGSHYWEVGISDFFVELGVAYGSLKRTNERENIIGRNSYSWSLQLRSMHHSVWHNNKETKLHLLTFTEIGIHLDMTAGRIAFYGVEDGSLQLLHSFSCLFCEKVFPVFWIGENTNVTIRAIPNGAMEAATEDLNDLL